MDNQEKKDEKVTGDHGRIDVEELDDKALDTVAGGDLQEFSDSGDKGGPNGVQCYC